MPLPRELGAPQHSNAQDLAYTTLWRWIVHGPLKPGETLRDMEIAELLGVSRTPVREALIRLAQEGLIDSAKGRGTKVADLRLDRAPHLFEVGGVLDAYAAELAAPRLTDTDRAELTRIMTEMEATADPTRLAQLDADLHDVYYLRSENPVLREKLTEINDELTRIERHAWGHTTIRAEAHHEHQELIAALTRGDGPAAAQAARNNWARSWNRLATLLR